MCIGKCVRILSSLAAAIDPSAERSANEDKDCSGTVPFGPQAGWGRTPLSLSVVVTAGRM